METLDQHIIDTAYTKFVQFGIRSVSIDDICSELRISKKTFYNVFPKKEDLIEAVLNYQFKVSVEKFKKINRNKNSIDALILMIKKVKDYANYEITAFDNDLEKYYPVLCDRFLKKKSYWTRKVFEKNLRLGIAEGYYREDLDVELSSMFHAVQIKNSYREMKASLPKKTKKQLVDFYTDVIVRSITNEKGFRYVEEQINKNNN